MSESPRVVTTVLGPIPPSELGITLAHEHVLLDLTCIWHPPNLPWQVPLVDAPVSAEIRGDLYVDPYVSRTNLQLDDPDVAVDELLAYRDSGGSALVDLTVRGIHPQPKVLAEIAQRTGLHIVAGCGYYVRRSHPPEVASLSPEQLAEQMLLDIEHGIDGTEVRAGIIGEIGTSSPIHPVEENVLRAAARTQQATGLALNVHVAIFGGEALNVLAVLEKAGANVGRVIISHMDELLDLEYHRAVLRRGATVEFDTFGSEFYFDDSEHSEPSDRERVEALLQLLHEGWASRLLLSHDVCTKLQLRRYGGFGYSHLLRTIVPRLRRRGVDQPTLDQMLIRNTRDILSHPA